MAKKQPDALAKFRNKVKRIQRETGKSFRAAQKAASAELKSGIGSRKKSSKGSRKKRHSNKSRSDSHHHTARMSGMAAPAVSASVEKARDSLHSELGWLMATQATARSAGEKKRLAPKIADLKRRLKALEK